MIIILALWCWRKRLDRLFVQIRNCFGPCEMATFLTILVVGPCMAFTLLNSAPSSGYRHRLLVDHDPALILKVGALWILSVIVCWALVFTLNYHDLNKRGHNKGIQKTGS